MKISLTYNTVNHHAQSYELTTQKQCQCGPLIGFIGNDDENFYTVLTQTDLNLLLGILDPSQAKTVYEIKREQTVSIKGEEPNYLVKVQFEF